MDEIKIVRGKAHIPFEEDTEKYSKKFKAFMGAKLSSKAKSNGAHEYENGNGYYPIASARSRDKRLMNAYAGKGFLAFQKSDNREAGLRVAFQIIYDSQSDIVKSSHEKTQTLNDGEKEITSTATICKFGGKDCIWLNEEECRNGTEKTMKFWTLELIDKAEPIDENWRHADYGRANKLHDQCYNALTENCTEEELKMLVEVETSSENNYETGTPVLESLISGIFQMRLSGHIDYGEQKTMLKELSQKLRNEALSSNDYRKSFQTIKEFGEKLTEETNKYKQEIERRKERTEREIQDALNKLDKEIDYI